MTARLRWLVRGVPIAAAGLWLWVGVLLAQDLAPARVPLVSDAAQSQWVIVLLAVISTSAMLWKSSRDQKHALELIRLQHDVDAADRREQAQRERAERESIAASVRERMMTDASNVQNQLHVSANAVRDRVEAAAVRADIAKIEIRDDARTGLAAQTLELKAAIDAASQFTAQKADAAYHESNNVNTKLEKLHEAHHAQGLILEQLLAQVVSGHGPLVPPVVAPGIATDA